MKCLISGHSQVKYFEQYVSLSNVKSLSYSGLSVEELLPNIIIIIIIIQFWKWSAGTTPQK